LKNIIHTLLCSRHRRHAVNQIRGLETQLQSPSARFTVPFVFKGRGYFKSIRPRQNPVEIQTLFAEVCKISPKRVLEIGTAKGGSLYLWIQGASNDATIVSVDLPGGEFGGAYALPRIPFYESFARKGQCLHLLRLNSHDSYTLKKVTVLFENNSIDFAFIDGDHTYEGVESDFARYGALVRPGGLIAIHDILPRPDLPAIQVDRFWAQIKDRYQTQEIIGSERSGRRIGIGLIRVPEGGLVHLTPDDSEKTPVLEFSEPPPVI